MNRFLWISLIVIFLGSSLASAEVSFLGTRDGTARYVTHQQPDFKHYYSGTQLGQYWPVLGDDEKALCEGRQDLLLSVAPLGCQPAVVRSDLLAEQNVPVFCQLDALRVNPLLDITRIRNVRFSGAYPASVAGVGFHPARAALRTRSDLMGSPLLNNIGYVVVVLKRQANESAQSSVNFTLQAQVDYYADNAAGIGSSSFYLHPVSDAQWDQERVRQSFFNGRYSIRLDEVDAQSARISLYEGDRKVSSRVVTRGANSDRFYLPGSYCQLGLRIHYDRFEPSQALARVQVGDDVVDLAQGGRFGNNKCTVQRLLLNETGAGAIDVRCASESFTLDLTPRPLVAGEQVRVRGQETSGLFTVISSNASHALVRDGLGQEHSFGLSLISLDDATALSERTYDDPAIDRYFALALDRYRTLTEDYPQEKRLEARDLTTTDSFAQQGLEQALSLAEDLGKYQTAAELSQLYLELYGTSPQAAFILDRFNRYGRSTSDQSTALVDIDGKTVSVRLVEFIVPEKVSRGHFNVDGQTVDIALGETKSFRTFNISVRSVDDERARIEVACTAGTSVSRETHTLSLNDNSDQSARICGGSLVRLTSTTLENYALIRLVPEARGPTIATNFSVGIGVEQRAFKLAPDKTKERIAELNKTIQKWQSLSTNLGNVVKTMKAACFATAGVLTVKNFVTGLEGTALARQNVMRGSEGWTEWCRDHINAAVEPRYESLEACYNANSAAINKDVDTMARLISADNTRIKAIERDHTSSSGTFGSYVNGNEAKEQFIRDHLSSSTYSDQVIDVDGRPVRVSSLLEPINGESPLTYEEAKTLKLHLDYRASAGNSPVASTVSNQQLERVASSVSERIASQERRESFSTRFGSLGQSVRNYALEDSQRGEWYETYISAEEITQLGLEGEVEPNTPVQVISVGEGDPRLVVLQALGTNEYGIVRSYRLEEQGGVTHAVEPVEGRVDGLRFSTFHRVSRASCSNRFEPTAVEAQFYENEGYKGVPALVPFDLEQGWYVATRQTVAALGGKNAFQSSGKPTSLWVCNVGPDGRPDFFVNGFDDDICQQFNLETGAPLNTFSCLSESESRELVNRAIRALEDAAHQRGQGSSSFVRIEGQSLKVGAPAVTIPGTQCQDFMSPGDCKLLFNVCDPVICPASRCDFGGAYPVTDVIQTGIVGSALLCLPNWNEGIYVPVCLTGIQAGIDGYVSILNAHKQCLEENLASGAYVGICDQISAVYTCEFFWRHAAPVANALLPKLVESFYNGGITRGGGEYSTVQASWDNAQASVNYFTQTYAVNSLEAFNVRSVADAGGEFCRAFVSTTAPRQFESLIEPDSPSQFHAWFSSVPYSDATVPATAQYKVFYHLFAGNDQGVSYVVYLKDPPLTSYYQTTSTIQVDSGYVARGTSRTETKDFTAPVGYQQLCVRVNEKEECGFKQVSTSFALNVVRDELVQEELEQTDIRTESACVSGRTSASALLNPDLGAAAQEAVDPAVYNRGITRICATQNPGSSTNPARFVDVGFCDDARTRCWLDVESVDRSLTTYNEGARNETLSVLQTRSQELREKDTFLYGEGESTLIDDLLHEASGPLTPAQADALAGRAETLSSQVTLQSQQAELIFIQGVAYEAATRGLFVLFDKRQSQPPVVETSSTGEAAPSPPAGTLQPTPFQDDFSDEPSRSLTIENALESIRLYPDSDSYTDHKALIDAFYSDGLLTEEEYLELNGAGVFNLQGTIGDLRALLKKKLPIVSGSSGDVRLAESRTNTLVLTVPYVGDDTLVYVKRYYGEDTGVSLRGSRVMFTASGRPVQIGTIEEGNIIRLLSSQRPLLESNDLSIGVYDLLSGARISGSEIIPSRT